MILSGCEDQKLVLDIGQRCCSCEPTDELAEAGHDRLGRLTVAAHVYALATIVVVYCSCIVRWIFLRTVVWFGI